MQELVSCKISQTICE